jgi:hypothetical protein
MYKTPVIHKVGTASKLIQTKVTGSGDGTNAGFSKIQLPPSLEVAGPASELIQAHMQGHGDGSNAGHSLVQCNPALET